MAYLDQFTKEQRDMLAALPYRTGLWISEADPSGGDAARALEMKALEAIVTGFVEDFCKSEFVEELMRETLAHKADWEAWRGRIDMVPEECRRAVDLLEGRMEPREILSFKHNLVEIALGVAAAYREEEAALSFVEKFKVYLGSWLPGRRAVNFSGRRNISRAEDKALSELTEALQVSGVDLSHESGKAA